MQNNSNLILLSIALAALLVLLGINYIGRPASGTAPAATQVIGSLSLDKKDVKGMAIEKDGKFYTLNLKQQTEAINYINRMLVVDKKDYVNRLKKFDFTKVIVYRFDKPDVNLIPVANEDLGIVFDIPLISSGSYMLDMSAGQFQSLIEKATQQ